MSSPFVWFHNNGNKPNEIKAFFESLLGFQSSGGPGGMTMLATSDGPFAALGGEDRHGDRDEWIPFVAVDDVDAATQRAVGLGASLVHPKRRGPAGEFTPRSEPRSKRGSGGFRRALRPKRCSGSSRPSSGRKTRASRRARS